MNKQNIKSITGNSSEECVSQYLTSQGWKVFHSRHNKGMADLIVYHEDLGSITYQVKTLTRQGGKHVAPIGLVIEGERPRVVLRLKDKSRYYKDNNIDWVVGVDPLTKQLYFYPIEVYSQHGTQLTVNTVKRHTHPEAPELEWYKKKNNIATLDELLG